MPHQQLAEQHCMALAAVSEQTSLTAVDSVAVAAVMRQTS